MPRKKKTVTEFEDEPEKEAVLEGGESDIEDALRSVPGGISTIKLYRVLPQGGRPKFLTEMAPEEFSESNVKEMYGGGSYKIRARKNDGKWGSSMFDIEGFPKKLAQADFEDEEEVESPIQSQIQNPIQQTQQAQQFDPFALMAMMQKAEERGEARMMKMLEFMRPQQQPPDVTKQVFEIVEKIAPMMSGGDGGGSPWMMALTQFKEPILKIVDSIQVALTRPQVAPPVQPLQAPVQVQQNPTQPSEEDMIQLLLRQYLPVFVNAARNNGNPDIYADMILEQIPENLYPKLEAWLTSSSWFRDIVSIEKNCEFQAGWWSLLRSSLLEGIKPDASTNLQPTAASEHGED